MGYGAILGQTPVQPAVGDIKTTVRTDLGNNWLLCNGEAVSEADYPELTALLPKNPLTGSWFKSDLGIGDQYQATCAAYLNGLWVVGAQNMNTGYPSIFYTSDLTNGWKQSAEINDQWCRLTDIAYYNGTWVACGYYTQSSYSGRVYITTNLSGTWTIKTNADGLGKYLHRVKYLNGYWIACGLGWNQAAQPAIYYATDPTGSWTEKNISTSNGNARDILYINGQWVVASVIGSYGTISVGTSLTSFNAYQVGTSYNYEAISIAYHNGVWVTALTKSGSGQIFTAKSPSGPWTAGNVIEALTSGTAKAPELIYDNGTWCLIGKTSSTRPVIYSAEDAAGMWDQSIIYADEGLQFDGVMYHDGIYVYVTSTKPVKLTLYPYVLPAITGDVYSYIKAKEA